MMRFLLKEADNIPEVKDPYPQIMRQALQDGEIGPLGLLFEKGYTPYSKDENGASVLDRAIKDCEAPTIFGILKIDINLATIEQLQRFLFLACTRGYNNLTRLVIESNKANLNKSNRVHCEVLMKLILCECNDRKKENIPLLLEHGAGSNQPSSSYQLTLLHKAAYKLRLQILSCFSNTEHS